MPSEQELLPPRYRRPELIGRGAMGDIFRAEDEELGRTVAVKVLSERYASDASIRTRFEHEALAAARLSGDPATITIFDVGEWEGRPFIVMEYLSGGSLEDRLRAGRPSTAEALSWLEQAAAALDSAHRSGVVHRDVKPGNFLLDPSGALKVADFGIASTAGMESLTMTGTVLGTAGYLSPEQAQGERASAASDRYALAGVAFELLTGRRPFESDSPTAEAAAHVHAPVPSVSAGSELPRELDPVFERALAKDPAQRFETGAEFVAAVRDALEAGVGTTRAFAPATRARRGPRLPLIAAFAAVAVAAGAALAAILSSGGDEQAGTPPGTTVRRTVTTVIRPPPPPRPPPPTTIAQSSIALTDEATRLLEQGDYAGAERAAREALVTLGGSGQPYEAYAEYDLGAALAHLGRCEEASDHLERSKKLQGNRKEINEARKLCKGHHRVR